MKKNQNISRFLKTSIRLLTLATLLAMGHGLWAVAHANPLEITNNWARATVGTQKTSAIYGTIINTTKAPLKLIAATSPNAARVEYHTHIKEEDGRMRMVKVPNITLPAGGQLVLQPMGNHIMLMGLNDALTAGNEIPVTLEFETENGEIKTQTFRSEIKPINHRPQSKDNKEPHTHHADHHHH